VLVAESERRTQMAASEAPIKLKDYVVTKEIGEIRQFVNKEVTSLQSFIVSSLTRQQ
jgi:hypothetical protein